MIEHNQCPHIVEEEDTPKLQAQRAAMAEQLRLHENRDTTIPVAPPRKRLVSRRELLLGTFATAAMGTSLYGITEGVRYVMTNQLPSEMTAQPIQPSKENRVTKLINDVANFWTKRRF